MTARGDETNERDSSGSLSGQLAVHSPAADEDELDRYRHEVEHCLGAELGSLEDGDIEAFFTHVIVGFERGEAAYHCAYRWLAGRPR